MSVGGWVLSISLMISALLTMAFAHAGTFGGGFVQFIVWGPVLLAIGVGVGMINAGIQNPVAVLVAMAFILIFFISIEVFNFPPGIWKYV